MPQELEGGGYYAYLPFIPVYATVFTYERRQHGAEPGHGAGEGEGHRPHHRGEQFRGVQVHDTPAHLPYFSKVKVNAIKIRLIFATVHLQYTLERKKTIC